MSSRWAPGFKRWLSSRFGLVQRRHWLGRVGRCQNTDSGSHSPTHQALYVSLARQEPHFDKLTMDCRHREIIGLTKRFKDPPYTTFSHHEEKSQTTAAWSNKLLTLGLVADNPATNPPPSKLV
eukprot:3474959-Amphidinium_carterae.1